MDVKLWRSNASNCQYQKFRGFQLRTPKSLRGVFKCLFAQAQRGKILEPYVFWKQHYLLSVDGSGHHSSSQVFCNNCCIKQLGTGQKIYYHHVLCGVLVHPEKSQVIPLAPEAVLKSETASKNDCEQQAAERLLRDFRREHPHLKTLVTEDGLYATGKHIKLLQELDLKFIITAKPGNLRSLYDWIESSTLTEVVRQNGFGMTQRYRFINQIPLNDTFFEQRVNFLEYDEIDSKGKRQHFAWITDIPLSEATLETVMRGGRVENETFNTLKNQGYEMGHNDGHGRENLCSNLGLLMMLAFLIDQLSNLADKSFQQARQAAKSYRVLWEDLRAIFKFFVLESFEEMYLKVLRVHRFSSS